MKSRKKKSKSGPGVVQEKVIYIDFKDKAIDKLYIKNGNRVTCKFNNVKVSFLTGLIIRYSPLFRMKIGKTIYNSIAPVLFYNGIIIV